MAANLNQCNFIGYAAAQPEVHTFNDGSKVANLKLAVTDVYTDKAGQKQEVTEWVPVVLNGKFADITPYIQKGSTIFVSGRLRTRSWQDQQGAKHYQTEIVCQTIKLLDKSQTAAAAPAPAAPAPAPAPAPQYAPPATQFAPSQQPPIAPAPVPPQQAYPKGDPLPPSVPQDPRNFDPEYDTGLPF